MEAATSHCSEFKMKMNGEVVSHNWNKVHGYYSRLLLTFSWKHIYT